jgi:serine/threonine protein phosphatase PrpC
MKYITHLIRAAKRTRSSLRNPVDREVFRHVNSFKRDPRVHLTRSALSQNTSLESYVNFVSKLPQHSDFVMDGISGARVKGPSFLEESQEDSKIVLTTLDLDLKGIKEDLIAANIIEAHSPNPDAAIIKMVESDFFKSLATYQSQRFSPQLRLKKPQDNAHYNPDYQPELKVDPSLSMGVISCQGQASYDEDRAFNVHSSSNNTFHAALKLEEDLYLAHYGEAQRLPQSGATYCGIISGANHKIVQNCGDSIAFYVNVLTKDDDVVVNLVRLNPLHEFEEDSYFNAVVQELGGNLFNKDEFFTPRLNGVREPLFSIGDHELGLTDFCQINTMIYPNFSAGLNPKSGHFTIIASDGILFDGKSEHSYVQLIRDYFKSNSDHLTSIIEGKDDKAKEEISQTLGEVIVKYAAQTGKDNVSLVIENIKPGVQLDDGKVSVTGVSDGHGGAQYSQEIKDLISSCQVFKEPKSTFKAKDSEAVIDGIPKSK